MQRMHPMGPDTGADGTEGRSIPTRTQIFIAAPSGFRRAQRRDDLLGGAIDTGDAQILVQHVRQSAVAGEHDGLARLQDAAGGPASVTVSAPGDLRPRRYVESESLGSPAGAGGLTLVRITRDFPQ